MGARFGARRLGYRRTLGGRHAQYGALGRRLERSPATSLGRPNESLQLSNVGNVLVDLRRGATRVPLIAKPLSKGLDLRARRLELFEQLALVGERALLGGLRARRCG